MPTVSLERTTYASGATKVGFDLVTEGTAGAGCLHRFGHRRRWRHQRDVDGPRRAPWREQQGKTAPACAKEHHHVKRWGKLQASIISRATE